MASRSPVTPEKQMLSKLHTDEEYRTLDELEYSPTTKNQLVSLKRKASDILDQGSPPTTSLFLRWRLAVVESQLEVKAAQRHAMNEVGVSAPPNVLTLLKSDEKALNTEKKFILSQRQILEEDLYDFGADKNNLTDAYITELRLSLEAASSSKDKITSLKSPRLDRKMFQRLVNEFLGTKKTNDYEESSRWCNVLGYWLPSNIITCAHIVPHSWDNRQMAHMFGSDEPPLTSKRNGLSLHNKIENAFDNCWVVIVPIDSVKSVPTEWKLVLLNESIKDKIFWEDQYNITSKKLWRWKDIDGRQLSFLNDNRPARRFLYLRYTLAWLHAADKAWPDFKNKVPPAEVWASPNKPDGYLRKSILLDLGKRTGDRIPQELIDAGTFDDPDTSSPVHDQIAGIKITEQVQDHLEGQRDTKADEDSMSESEEDD